MGMMAIALLCLQCAMSSSGLPEGGTITLTKEDAGKTVEIAVGDVIQIELFGTPSTGSWWHFEVLDEEYLEIIKKETMKTSPERLEGAPILGIWHLRAKKAGETAIEMAYYRPWEGGDKARNHFRLNVQIRPGRR